MGAGSLLLGDTADLHSQGGEADPAVVLAVAPDTGGGGGRRAGPRQAALADLGQ